MLINSVKAVIGSVAFLPLFFAGVIGSVIFLPLFFTGSAIAQSGVCSPQPSDIAQATAAARAVVVDREKGYLTTEIRDGVYWITDGNFTAAIVETGEGVVVIDAPSSLGEHLMQAIAEITDQPVTHVIYSHAHADHIGGAWALPGGATYIASRGAAEELETVNEPSREYPFGIFVEGGKAVPSPTIVVDTAHTLRVGNKVFELDVISSSHSHGDMTTYLPDQKVLVAVDFTWPSSVPWIRLGDAVNVPGLIAANEQILSYDFDTLIAGHTNSVGTREDVALTIAYLKDLRAASVTALRTVTVSQVAQETGKMSTYVLMDEYFNRLIETAAAPVVEEWQDRLQGAGVWTCDHAQKMISSLRFDEAVE